MEGRRPLTEINVEEEAFKSHVLRKVSIRIIPLLSLGYILAFLDRINFGNAHLYLVKPLPTNDTNNNNSSHGYVLQDEMEYGWAVSIFYLGYAIFEIPSNMLLKKTSAPFHFARLLFSWGIISVCTMWITDVYGASVCRFFLGIAEAGYFPGVIYYLSTWFSPSEMAVRFGLFYCATPIAGLLGGILSYAILQMDGIGGLFGWQWLFLLEGIPTVLLSFVFWFLLPKSPQNCTFLTPNEQEWVIAHVKPFSDIEPHKLSLSDAKSVFKNWRVWVFGVLMLSLTIPINVINFFSPAIINQFGFTPLESNLLSAPMYFANLIHIILLSSSSGYFKEQPIHIGVTIITSLCGWAGLAFSLTQHGNVAFQYSMLLIAVMSSSSVIPIIWAWITRKTKGGTQVAVSVGLINSFAICAGLIGPNLASGIQSATSSYEWVAGTIAAVCIFALCMVVTLKVLLRMDVLSREKDSYERIK